MKCPECGAAVYTIDSRNTTLDGIATTRRRRECRQCGNRFSTYEIEAANYERLRVSRVKYTALLQKVRDGKTRRTSDDNPGEGHRKEAAD